MFWISLAYFYLLYQACPSTLEFNLPPFEVCHVSSHANSFTYSQLIYSTNIYKAVVYSNHNARLMLGMQKWTRFSQMEEINNVRTKKNYEIVGKKLWGCGEGGSDFLWSSKMSKWAYLRVEEEVCSRQSESTYNGTEMCFEVKQVQLGWRAWLRGRPKKLRAGVGEPLLFIFILFFFSWRTMT